MSKQQIFVRHKDEIFKKYKEHIDFMWENRDNVDIVLRDGLMKGYKEALEWVLGLDKTQEEKDEKFEDKIDELTNKKENRNANKS
tara:strand:+ start:1154 stop:1408 length:255 start_codon:yes stop_codon:yes gene_type:complete